jgi:hypothetical protein
MEIKNTLLGILGSTPLTKIPCFFQKSKHELQTFSNFLRAVLETGVRGKAWWVTWCWLADDSSVAINAPDFICFTLVDVCCCSCCFFVLVFGLEWLKQLNGLHSSHDIHRIEFEHWLFWFSLNAEGGDWLTSVNFGPVYSTETRSLCFSAIRFFCSSFVFHTT